MSDAGCRVGDGCTHGTALVVARVLISPKFEKAGPAGAMLSFLFPRGFMTKPPAWTGQMT